MQKQGCTFFVEKFFSFQKKNKKNFRTEYFLKKNYYFCMVKKTKKIFKRKKHLTLIINQKNKRL
ncbi:MAG: hypothetical protein CW341_11060 [Bacteroidetes bacterium]|nr:hypothetical protein [Bacteroidota bacterium]